jgi:hypothetical protein
MGRGAVNQKGPESALLAALHAIRGANRKLPVNLVLVAEGEEEIGSPNFPQIVRRPEVHAALKRCNGVFMPFAAQGLDGQVTMYLGAKGIIELELVSTGERWSRGPAKIFTRATRRALTVLPGTWSRHWRLLFRLTEMIRRSRDLRRRRGRSRKQRRR